MTAVRRGQGRLRRRRKITDAFFYRALADKKANEFYHAAYDDKDNECHDHAAKGWIGMFKAHVVHRSLAY
jgi:hypothetical protein